MKKYYDDIAYAMELSLTIRMEPVFVESVGEAGYCKDFQIEQEIVCTETIPSGKPARQYIISIHKDVEASRDVFPAEQKLIEVIRDLEKAWLVITGYMLGHVDSSTIRPPRYESNAEQVEQALREKEKRTFIIKSCGFSYEIENSYKTPPLEKALILRKAFREDAKLEKLLQYLSKGFENDDCWFIHLYKVKDQLNAMHYDRASNFLSIPESEWEQFERSLNNYDLRHPGHESMIGIISSEEINRLRLIAKGWVIKELSKRNLPLTLS